MMIDPIFSSSIINISWFVLRAYKAKWCYCLYEKMNIFRPVVSQKSHDQMLSSGPIIAITRLSRWLPWRSSWKPIEHEFHLATHGDIGRSSVVALVIINFV